MGHTRQSRRSRHPSLTYLGNNLPGYILNALVFLSTKTIQDAYIPNKIGDQDRLTAGGQNWTGRALVFDQVDQYAYKADNGALDINQASTDFCFGGKIKTGSDITTIQYPMGKYSSGAVDGRYGFYIFGGSLYCAAESSGGAVAIIDNITLAVNTEYHVLMRVDRTGKKVYFYIDDILQNAGGTAITGTFGTLANVYEFYLGAGNGAGGGSQGSYFGGQLRDVRIFHKDVTADISTWMNGGYISDAVAWWFCEGNSTTEVEDSSGNGYHMTASNFDSTSFATGMWQNLMNKWGYNDDAGTIVAPDMSTYSGTAPTHDVDGTALVFKGQAKYNAISKDRSCYQGDGSTYWNTDSDIDFNSGDELEFKFITSSSIGTEALIGQQAFSDSYFYHTATAFALRLNTVQDVYNFAFSTNTEYTVKIKRISDSDVELYIDGSLVDTLTGYSGNVAFNQIGARTGVSLHYLGKIIYVKKTGAENWQFIEGQGSTVYDVSQANGNNLTGVNVANNNWTVIPDPDEDYIQEHGSNFAGFFDGTDDVASKDVADYLSTAGSGSVKAFLKVINGTSTIAFASTDVLASSWCLFQVDSARKPKITVRLSSGVNNQMLADVAITEGWHEIEFISTGSAYDIKVDGVSVAFTASIGADDGKWFSYATARDNISIGAILDGSPTYGYNQIQWVKVDDGVNGDWVVNPAINGYEDRSSLGHDLTFAGNDSIRIIPALADKSTDVLGQVLVYPQNGANLIPQTYFAMPEDIWELYIADQQERYEGGLMDAGKGTFDSGTESWVALGNNTIANVADALQITFVDNVAGARVYMRAIQDINTDLTIGDTYIVKALAKATGTCKLRIDAGVVATDTDNLTSEYVWYTIEFIAESTTLTEFKCWDMSAGEVITIDTWELFHKTTQTGNNLITNGGARNDIGALITTDWADTAGLGDGYATDATPTIVTGNGFSGNAQKIAGDTGEYIQYDTDKFVNGESYEITFKYRADGTFKLENEGVEDIETGIVANTGDAISKTITYTAGGAGKLRFTLENDGTYLEIDEVEQRTIIPGEFYEPLTLGGDAVTVLTDYFQQNPYRYLVRYFDPENWKNLILVGIDSGLTYAAHLKLLQYTNND